MTYEDQEFSCLECGEKFVFTAQEQSQWTRRGFVHQPKRCRKCRQERRQRRGEQQGGSGGVTGYGRESQGIYRSPSFREEQNNAQGNCGPPPYASSCRPQRPSTRPYPSKDHEITCPKCGRKDFLPFRPIPGREVFCHECYQVVKKGKSEPKGEAAAQASPAAQEKPAEVQPTPEAPIEPESTGNETEKGNE